jgi:4-amino-4-deoxy-L-arabinose transferase-like glycosyltransferase
MPAFDSQRLARIGAPALIAAAFVGLAARGWRRWPDVQIDFGHQLYIPWQISEGKVLYRDIYYGLGPFSQYLNALWFEIFGVSLTTLMLCNLAILALVTALVYCMFTGLFDRLTATACCLVMLGVFAFGHLAHIGNYNFVTPYTHETTHGTALAIGMLYALYAALSGGRRWGVFVAGVCLGLSWLTRPEVVAAAGAAAATALVLDAWLAPRPVSRLSRHAVALAAGVAAALLVAYALLWAEMGPGPAASALVVGWTTLFQTDLVATDWYKIQGGLDRPLASTAAMFAAGARIGVAIGAAALVEFLLPRPRDAKLATLGAAALTFAAAGLWAAADAWPWGDLARGLPLVGLAALGLLLAAFARARSEPPQARRLVLPLAWAVFALAYTGKIALFAKIHHYGFYLSLPLVLIAVALLLGEIPEALARRGRGAVFRGAALGLVAAVTVAHLSASDRFYRLKTFEFGSGGDMIRSYAPETRKVGWGLEQARRWIEANAPQGASLVALPYGIMLNYQTRRPNPTPWVRFTELDFAQFDEAAIIATLERTPPDVVAFVHAPPDTPGMGYFGSDPRNGRELARWIRAHYGVAERIGAPPFAKQGFGVEILLPREAGRAE